MRNKLNALVAGAKCKATAVLNRKDAGIETLMVIALVCVVAVALTAMSENGIQMQAAQTLTRGDVAQVMYQVSRLAINAPGLAVIRMQD